MTWEEGRRGKGEGAGGEGECDSREASQTLPFFWNKSLEHVQERRRTRRGVGRLLVVYAVLIRLAAGSSDCSLRTVQR